MTVEKLRAELRTRGLRVSGLKADLITRLLTEVPEPVEAQSRTAQLQITQ